MAQYFVSGKQNDKVLLLHPGFEITSILMLLLVLSYSQTEENVIRNGCYDVTDKLHGSVELENAIERPDGDEGLVVVCNQSERCLSLCNTCYVS